MEKPTVHKLKNGLTVAILPYTEVGSVTIHLRGKCGSNYENKNEIGSAHILEHLSFKRNQLSNLITAAGGKVVGVTSRDDVLFMTKLLADDIEKGFVFLSNIFDSGNINEKNFQVSKEIIRQEIKRYINMPEKYIGRISYRILFPDQRLGMLNTGDLKDIDNLTIDNVGKFRQRTYFSNNFVLTICGNCKPRKTVEMANRYFSDVVRGTDIPQIKHKESPQFQSQVINNPYYTQTHIKIDFYGYKTSDSKKYSSFFLGKILDKLLKSSLKDRQGLVYNINCDSFSTGSYGLFGVYAAGEEKNTRKIIEEIKTIIINSNKLINEATVHQIRNSLLADLVFAFEKTSQRADYYSELLLHGRKNQNHLMEMKKIRAMTQKEVLSIAHEILSQDPKITVLANNIRNEDIQQFWSAQTKQ